MHWLYSFTTDGQFMLRKFFSLQFHLLKSDIESGSQYVEHKLTKKHKLIKKYLSSYHLVIIIPELTSHLYAWLPLPFFLISLSVCKQHPCILSFLIVAVVRICSNVNINQDCKTNYQSRA